MTVAANGHARPGDYAACYLDAGLSIIPIRGDSSKAPTVEWTRYQSELPALQDLSRWYLADNVGVAIVYGSISGNAELIDVDRADIFGPYCEEVERLSPGLIDRLTIIQTPRPGYHLVYRCEKIEGSQKLAQDPTGKKTLIETRGQGGYALAPGSPAECHETGRLYEHYRGPELTDLPTISPDDRDILVRVAVTFDQRASNQRLVEPTQNHAGLTPGNDYNQRVSWEDILLPHGWELNHSSGDKGFWRRPGKSNGWSATTGLKSTSGNELFCCFSSNAAPFEGANGRSQCTSYSKFAAYATLNHGGDYSAAAKQLSADGYGDRPSQSSDSLDSLGPVPTGERKRKPILKLSLSGMRQQFPKLSSPVADGLFREGETGNFISVPKIGKSWGVYGLGISVTQGWDWLGRFPTAQGPVLLVDNELSPAVLASRIPKVAAAMFAERDEFIDDSYEQLFDIWSLRGNLRTLEELGTEFEKIEPNYYKLIIFDAKYRFILAGVSENDNSAQTQVYNLLDRYAAQLNSAILLVHHSSKGSQSEKRTTDVGSGAGAQSRAADCHMVLREHEEEGHVVLEAAVRSFPPVEPLTLKWDFPLWQPTDLDPADLKGKKTKSEERQAKNDSEGRLEIAGALLDSPLTASKLRKVTGYGSARVDRLLAMMVKGNEIQARKVTVGGNECDEYSLAETAL